MEFQGEKSEEERIDRVLFVRVENVDGTFSIYNRMNLVQIFMWMGCKANRSYKMTKMLFKTLTKSKKSMCMIPECPPMDHEVLSMKKSLQKIKKKKIKKMKKVEMTRVENGEVITSIEEVEGESDEEDDIPDEEIKEEEEEEDDDSEEEGEKSFCSSSTDATTAFFSRKFFYDSRFLTLEEFGLKSKKVRNERSNTHLIQKMSRVIGKQYVLKYRYYPEYMSMITDFKGIMMMTREDFNNIIKICLVAFNYNRLHRIQYFDLSCHFHDRKWFMIVLFAGTSGTGKSTLGSLLCSRLGIDRFISTDSIRHCLRENVNLSQKEREILFCSSYTVGNLDHFSHIKRLTKRIIDGYKSHCKLLYKHLDHLIASFIRRKESVIIEGVHLTSATMIRLLRKYKGQNIFPYVIHISNENKHRIRFGVRAKHMTLDPKINKYVKHFKNIRLIQSYLIKQANLFSIPKINNTIVDRSVAFLHYSLLKTIKLVADGGYSIWDESKKQIQMVDPNEFTDEFKSKRMMAVMKKKRRFLEVKNITSGGEEFKRRRKKPRPSQGNEKEESKGFVHEDKRFLTKIGSNSKKKYNSDSILESIDKSKRKKRKRRIDQQEKKIEEGKVGKLEKKKKKKQKDSSSTVQESLSSKQKSSSSKQGESEESSVVVGGTVVRATTRANRGGKGRILPLPVLSDGGVPWTKFDEKSRTVSENITTSDWQSQPESNDATDGTLISQQEEVDKETVGKANNNNINNSKNTNDINNNNKIGRKDDAANKIGGNLKKDNNYISKNGGKKKKKMDVEEVNSPSSAKKNPHRAVGLSTKDIISNKGIEERLKKLKKLKKFTITVSDTKSGHAGSDSSNNDESSSSDDDDGDHDDHERSQANVKTNKKKVKRGERKKVKKKIIVVSSKSMISLHSTSSEEEKQEKKRRKKMLMRAKKRKEAAESSPSSSNYKKFNRRSSSSNPSSPSSTSSHHHHHHRSSRRRRELGRRKRSTSNAPVDDNKVDGLSSVSSSSSSSSSMDDQNSSSDDGDDDEALAELDGESDDDDEIAGDDDDGINEIVREKKKEMREKDEKEKKMKELEKKKKEKVRRRKKKMKDVKEKGEMIIVRQRAEKNHKGQSVDKSIKRKASSDNERM